MSELERARQLWLVEEKQFEKYANLMEDEIRRLLQPVGVWFEVTSRAKSIDSLIKKLIKKPKHTYNSLPDKAGVRVIVRYRSDIDKVVPLLIEALHCNRVDYKEPHVDSVGYMSTHLDKVRLPDKTIRKAFPFSHFWVELQVRTLAQNLWSEMSHDAIYKNDDTIAQLPRDVKRRVNLMAGQIEVADREFDRIGKETRAEDAAELLRVLEPTYYSLTSKRPDIELSLLILRLVIPLYGNDFQHVKQDVEAFVKTKMDFFRQRYTQAQESGSFPVSPLFFQPEALVLYQRLLADKSGLRRAWTEQFPEGELQHLATDFGIGF